ncbi:hypothetical protein TVAG_227360 [Trichomonas vaginalis G3]|uniref:Uncharacterized protein n=1 Tax=Trichomonas vaginalis (strain ATCC PRA-98 / G3) TaxID=412133 RepID=A2GCE6_TRIV3|nr:hypothetical protein TVAG_227360 [Trichomonas vaginalis G3]|eukprot:XP_001298101.1 hypothetical protein [Trichomonas vaginalis G3]
MTGSCGLKSMEFSREDEYPLTSYVTNGTFSYTDSKSILPGSVNSNTEYYADINLMNNQNMRLRSGSYVLTFASGQSYNISQNQFIAFHTPKDQKICDVTASVKSGKNSETLLGNTSIYGVYYKSDGQLTLNSTKKYSSLYVTVYSANSGDGFFDEMFVLLGNTSQFIITDNHPVNP